MRKTSALSTSTLSALQEFYAERDARSKQFEDLKAISEQNAASSSSQKQQKLSMDAFAEDWNESQFWYADETAVKLAEELLDGAFVAAGERRCVIAVVSAPSVFVQVKNLLVCEFWWLDWVWGGRGCSWVGLSLRRLIQDLS